MISEPPPPPRQKREAGEVVQYSSTFGLAYAYLGSIVAGAVLVYFLYGAVEARGAAGLDALVYLVPGFFLLCGALWRRAVPVAFDAEGLVVFRTRVPWADVRTVTRPRTNGFATVEYTLDGRRRRAVTVARVPTPGFLADDEYRSPFDLLYDAWTATGIDVRYTVTLFTYRLSAVPLRPLRDDP